VRIGRSRWTTSFTLRCPRPANHHDQVTTFHLPGGQPGPIANICTAARDAREIQGDTVTTSTARLHASPPVVARPRRQRPEVLRRPRRAEPPLRHRRHLPVSSPIHP
jgi:hypothetical protein